MGTRVEEVTVGVLEISNFPPMFDQKLGGESVEPARRCPSRSLLTGHLLSYVLERA